MRESRLGARRWWILGLIAVTLVGVLALIVQRRQPSAAPAATSVLEHDVTAWAAPRTLPLSDSQAAALVVHHPEQRPANIAANDYVPSDAELAAFHAAHDRRGRTTSKLNPLLRYVTGRPGLPHPSTDDLIQWASHKWGIPTNWIRAQLDYESVWHQSQLGDETAVSRRSYERYPGFSQVPGGTSVYESLGIAQVKWSPSGSVGVGTEPLRWKSTAFNLDYYAATLRFFYDGDCRWCSAGYGRGQAWQSVGAWFEPGPWANRSARRYITIVRQRLAGRSWTRPGF